MRRDRAWFARWRVDPRIPALQQVECVRSGAESEVMIDQIENAVGVRAQV